MNNWIRTTIKLLALTLVCCTTVCGQNQYDDNRLNQNNLQNNPYNQNNPSNQYGNQNDFRGSTPDYNVSIQINPTYENGKL